jgi:hypothetical protein
VWEYFWIDLISGRHEDIQHEQQLVAYPHTIEAMKNVIGVSTPNEHLHDEFIALTWEGHVEGGNHCSHFKPGELFPEHLHPQVGCATLKLSVGILPSPTLSTSRNDGG